MLHKCYRSACATDICITSHDILEPSVLNVKSAIEITGKRVFVPTLYAIVRRSRLSAHAYKRGGAWHKHGGAKIQNVQKAAAQNFRS